MFPYFIGDQKVKFNNIAEQPTNAVFSPKNVVRSRVPVFICQIGLSGVVIVSLFEGKTQNILRNRQVVNFLFTCGQLVSY